MKIFRYLDKAGSMGFGRFDEQGQMFLILKKKMGISRRLIKELRLFGSLLLLIFAVYTGWV